MYIECVLDEMKMLGTPNPQKFIPCTEEEVIRLEQVTHFSLPQAYQEFLRTMGNSTDDFLVGSDFLYPVLPSLQEWARELLIENQIPQKFPDDAFVFFMHQGYQFNFFHTSEGEDPPVYRYFEGTDLDLFQIGRASCRERV